MPNTVEVAMKGQMSFYSLILIACVVLPGPAFSQGVPASKGKGRLEQNQLGKLPEAATPPQLAARLIALTDQFIATVPQDLGDSSQAQRLIDRGNNLLIVSKRFREIFDKEITPQRRWFALEDVKRAFGALHDDLLHPPTAAHLAGPLADKIGQVIALLDRAGFTDSQTPILPREVPREESLRLWRLTAVIAEDNQQLITYLRSLEPPNAFANRLRLQAEKFGPQVEAFRARVPGEENPRRLEGAFKPVRDQALVINEFMSNGSPYPRLAERWRTIRDNLARVEETMGVKNDIPTPPDTTGEGTLRTIPRLPMPVPTAPAKENQAAVTAVDRALTRLDAFLNTLEPNAGPTDEKAKLQMIGRELRGNLAALRQVATRNGPRSELKSLLEEMNTRFELLRSRLVRASRQNPELDSFRFHDLRDALEQLRRAIA
jgi:hypothetical protein